MTWGVTSASTSQASSLSWPHPRVVVRFEGDELAETGPQPHGALRTASAAGSRERAKAEVWTALARSTSSSGIVADVQERVGSAVDLEVRHADGSGDEGVGLSLPRGPPQPLGPDAVALQLLFENSPK